VIGGAEVGAFELGRRLIGQGHLVSVLTPRVNPAWKLAEAIDGLDVHRYDVPAIVGRERTASLVAGSFARLGGLLRRLAPDVLNMHYLLPTGVAGQWWASRLGIPTVLTLIGMDVYDPSYRPPRLFRGLMRRAARRADAVTCISTFVRDVVAREYPPAPPAPFVVIPYGVDTKRFRPGTAGDVRDRYGIGRREKLVLTVQRLYRRKGVHEFIQAAALVLRDYHDVRFLIVGDGPERAALERLTASVGVSARVTFAGAVDNAGLAPFYAASDVFVFHTFHEGLGIVLLEAAASGLPVVTTQAGGTVDIVRNGMNGVIVPPGDHRALAGATVRLLRDETLRETLGRCGRDMAKRDFDWDVVAEKYLEVFRRAQRPFPGGLRGTL
jgi:glycosyltransferase involved in cell wall biosynthesis